MQNLTHQQGITEEATREQLERILCSRLFASSRRLCRFLRYVVESSLSGTADSLKESLIGTDVYDRNSGYDPSQDSIVRTESRRLRTKLKEYYESDGKNDPIVISFRLGSYAPKFQVQNAARIASEAVFKKNGTHASITEGTGVCVAVIPFTDVSGQPLSSRCAKDLTDELIHELTLTRGVRVAAASAITSSGSQTEIIPELAKKLEVQLIFEGTVREETGRLRVISRLVNFDGFQVCSQRFEAKANLEGLFALTERLASTLVYRVRPEQSVVRELNATVSNSLLSLLPQLLAAEQLLDEGSVSDIQRALVTFAEIDRALPQFGRPLCDIAQARCEIALQGVPDSAKLVAAGKDPAERAMALDPGMISAGVARALVQMLQWDWKGAEESFQHALDLGAHACGYRQYGLYLTALARFDDAFHYLQKAQEIDPFSARQKVAFIRFFHLSGRGTEASHHFEENSAFGPPPIDAQILLAFIEARAGHREEAMRMAQACKREAGAQPGLMAWVVGVMALCGEVEAAKQITQQTKLLSPEAPLSYFRRSLLALALNEHTAALSNLTKAYEQREPEMIWLGTDPRFDSIRKTPEFLRISEAVQP